MLLEPSVSPPSLRFHRLPATAGVRKKKKKKNKRAMWRQANLKAITDHQPPWLVWLQCARCNWLGTAIRSFNRKYTLSLSISFKKWQHWGKAKLPPPKQQFPYKKWIHCVRRSNSDPPAIKLRDSLQVTPAKWLEMYSSHYFSLLSILLLPVDCWKAASKGTRYICF